MPQPSPPSRPSYVVPKQTSGTPYVVGMGVLFLIIGGMLWYKMRSTEPTKPQPSASAPGPSATPPPTFAFDLPPPPAEVDAAAEPEAGPKKTAPGGVAPTACGGPCEGKGNAAMESALRGAGGAARGCYERALRNNAMIQGQIVVAVRLSPTGSVCSASIAQDSVGSSEVSSCVLGLFRGRTFPPPTGGSCADANVPMSFKPQEGRK